MVKAVEEYEVDDPSFKMTLLTKSADEGILRRYFEMNKNKNFCSPIIFAKLLLTSNLFANYSTSFSIYVSLSFC